MKSMKSLLENYENYQKNLLCLQDVANRLLSHMKGHGVSFRPEITDENGAFSQEKLCSLVGEILSLWAEKQREGTFTDPKTGESLSEPWIQDRRELYGSYLYLVMRCSLNKGDYALVRGGTMKARTDFAFLLEQAKRLWRNWCVMSDSDGNKKNELLWGYDEHFGFHLYRVLSCPKAGYDYPMSNDWDLPVHRPALMTEEGNVKRSFFKKIYCGKAPDPWAVRPKGTVEEDEDSGVEEEPEEDEDLDGYDAEEEYEDEYGYEYDEDGFSDFVEDWIYPEGYEEAMYEEGERWAQKQADLEYLVLLFTYQAEYLAACRKFAELFEQAKPEVLKGFCEDLEEMVSLYLVKRGIPPLMDTDQVLDVYSSIYDGPCRQAERCARGAQWKNL